MGGGKPTHAETLYPKTAHKDPNETTLPKDTDNTKYEEHQTTSRHIEDREDSLGTTRNMLWRESTKSEKSSQIAMTHGRDM